MPLLCISVIKTNSTKYFSLEKHCFRKPYFNNSETATNFFRKLRVQVMLGLTIPVLSLNLNHVEGRILWIANQTDGQILSLYKL